MHCPCGRARRRAQLLIGIGERGLGGGALGLALVDRGLERLRLDREDDLAFLTASPSLNLRGPRKPLHPRPQIDLFDRFRAPDKLRLLGHRPQLGWLDQHRRRRPALLRVRRKADQHRNRRGEDENKMSPCHRIPQPRPNRRCANYSNLPSGSENTSVVPAKETGDGPDLNPA